MRVFPAVYVLLLATVSYGALALFSGGFIMPDPRLVLILFIMTLTNYIIRSYRWKMLLEHYGMHVSFAESVKTYFAGLFFIVTPAKAGEVIKSELMHKRHGFRKKKVAFIILVERAFDILSHGILAGITALLVAGAYVRSVWVFLLLAIAGMVGVYLARNKLKFIRDELEALSDFRLVAKSLVLSLFSWTFEDLEVWVAVLWLGGTISLPQAFFAFSASLILGNIALLPGGLGASEASLAGLLAFFSVSLSIATTVTIVTRMTTLWFGFVIGAVFWFWAFHKKVYKTAKTNQS